MPFGSTVLRPLLGSALRGRGDDALAINSALEQAGLQHGGLAFLPTGSCVVGSSIMIPENIPIPVADLLSRKEVAAMELHPEDEIRVAVSGKIYIAASVGKPGLYLLNEAHDIIALQRRRWRKAGLSIALCVGGALACSSFASRIYETPAVIELDKRTPSTVIGQEAQFSSLPDTFSWERAARRYEEVIAAVAGSPS